MKCHQNLSQLNARDFVRTIRPGLRFTPMAAAIAAGLFALVPDAAMAATITVGVNGCTLANAINNANANSNADGAGGCIAGSGADTITLPAFSTRTLTSALPDVTSTITIEGNNATVKRSSTAPAFRMFTVTDSGDLSLNRISLSGGLAVAGGGIFSEGILKLTRSTVSGNTAEFSSGGIFNFGGTADLIDSTVSGNQVTDNINGVAGGLLNYGGSLSLTRSTVSGNRALTAGGVLVLGGTLTLSDSTVSGNTGTTTFGGLLSSYSVALLTNSTVSGNSGGVAGGGIGVAGGFVELTDSTVSGNSAGVAGGVLVLNGDAIVSRSLISGNLSDGNNPPEFVLGDNPVDPGSVTVGDHNLFGFNGDPGVSGFTVDALSTDIVPSGPVAGILAPLADNGGPTRSHLLVAGSPAIDAAGPDCSDTDQRGMLRPQGEACDIGAVEVIDPVTTLTLAPTSASRPTLETQCVTVTAANSAGDGAANVAVDFTRTGANPGTQTVATNGQGQAQHCWSGINGGVDHVTASFEELVSNESVITWNKRVTNIAPAAVVGVFVPSQQLIRIAPKATLRDANGNVPIAGRTVQFTAGSAPLCQAVTNASGVATCNASLSSTLRSVLALGYTATFSGDTSYRPVQKKSPLVTIKLGL
ncbi:MAG: choice-of-anchor Q domain-containing protein [Panacagrimonas sp.]